MFCDLHLHSTASDGSTPPGALPALACAAGLGAIALTDHDTTAGLPECQAACAAAGILFIPGIELSADPSALWADAQEGPVLPRLGTLHILGYFVRHDAPSIQAIHLRLLEARAQRNPRIIANLQTLGVSIEYDEVVALAHAQGTRVVGRPHIAQVLVRKGYAKTVQDAFARYIGEGKAAFARSDLLAPRDAIDAIHEAGGLAVMAHPVQLRLPSPDALEYALARLHAWGLDGVETRHSDHAPADVAHFQQLADRFGLVATGGSDFHGDRKAISLGSQRVPLAVAEHLKSTWESRGAR